MALRCDGGAVATLVPAAALPPRRYQIESGGRRDRDKHEAARTTMNKA